MMILIAVGVPVLLAIIIVGYIVSKRNTFVVLEENIENAFSQIDVQLKRRYDLIPNLVNTVKGFADHEKGTLEQVTGLRNAAAGATDMDEKVDLNNQLDGALSRLLVTVEAYPDIKANTNFLDLQGELKQTEQKIAVTRQIFNDCVMKMNRMVKKFPSNIIAGMFNFETHKYLETAESERENVKVEF